MILNSDIVGDDGINMTKTLYLSKNKVSAYETYDKCKDLGLDLIAVEDNREWTKPIASASPAIESIWVFIANMNQKKTFQPKLFNLLRVSSLCL